MVSAYHELVVLITVGTGVTYSQYSSYAQGTYWENGHMKCLGTDEVLTDESTGMFDSTSSDQCLQHMNAGTFFQCPLFPQCIRKMGT
jgi:hypothetical protein